jgi:hypothetical protein
MKDGGLMPKMTAVPGFLRAERKRCGRPNCRCARGELHGPYWYRRWREQGRQRRRYVAPGELPGVRAALARWRAPHPPAWPVRRQLAELRRLMKELD